MENISKNTPRDVFLHLLGFAALYASVITFLVVVFNYVNFLFPDRLSFNYESILSGIRLASSALIVIFPVFIFISWLLGREFDRFPARKEGLFRKWLIYFTLFAAAVAIIVDLVILVFNFYSGELTTRFILKVAAVLLITAVVFSYYFWDLKRKAKDGSRKSKIAAWVASATVLALIIGGFFIVGSPATQRLRRFDEQRVSDLQTIQGQIVNYWTRKESLPPRLDDLNDSISGFIPPVDPESGVSYEYRVLDELSFELCADFKISNLELGLYPSADSRAYPMGYKTTVDNWLHEAGRACFERNIDPELYRQILKEEVIRPL